MEEGLLSGKQNLYFSWFSPVAIFVIGLLLSLYYWRRKEVKELTPEGKLKLKEQEVEFYPRWYVRYFGVACALTIAFESPRDARRLIIVRNLVNEHKNFI